MTGNTFSGRISIAIPIFFQFPDSQAEFWKAENASKPGSCLAYIPRW